MGRKRHPSKEVEAALKVLEAVGWTAKEAKGRSAHAWGYVLCPANARRCLPFRGFLSDVGLEYTAQPVGSCTRVTQEGRWLCVEGGQRS